MSWLALIDVPYWGDATLLEIFWLCSGIVATGFTLLNINDSWKDRRLLKIIKGDTSVHDRHYRMIALSAHGRLTSQLSRLAISVLIVASGMVGVLTANPLRGETTLTGLTVTVALVMIGAITAGRSYFDWRQRNLLYELARGRSEVIAARLRAIAEED